MGDGTCRVHGQSRVKRRASREATSVRLSVRPSATGRWERSREWRRAGRWWVEARTGALDGANGEIEVAHGGGEVLQPRM